MPPKNSDKEQAAQDRQRKILRDYTELVACMNEHRAAAISADLRQTLNKYAEQGTQADALVALAMTIVNQISNVEVSPIETVIVLLRRLDQHARLRKMH